LSNYNFVTKTGTIIYYTDNDDISEELTYSKSKLISTKKYIETYSESGFVNKLDFFEITH
jgi:hypothetical protein